MVQQKREHASNIIYVTPDVHKRIKTQTIQYGFRYPNELLTYWLDSVEEEEKKEQYSISHKGEQI